MQQNVVSDTSRARSAFEQDVVSGLKQSQKSLPAKYFYDTYGSALFDQICELEEYYPYRTELAMLPSVAQDLSHIVPEPLDVVEYGAGSLVKIRLLLRHMSQIERFIPIDIAGEHLENAADDLRQEFPKVTVEPMAADFTAELNMPGLNGAKRMAFFPGSTIGNFSPQFAQTFLQRVRSSLGPGALLLIGVDTKKSANMLHKAYNDSEGVTRKFNLNILTHINRELDADFDTEYFDHYAFYNPTEGRIEMHLISQKAQTVSIGDQRFYFDSGESIHTENSHKYTPEQFLQLAQGAGWRSVRKWVAGEQLFTVFLLRASED
ncbi:L-histidine N(alpha)-methyltransferase [Pseudomaricurvus alkylphenolicus]|uniref:L-histidine N(alpha)-methyltransferase n=1 Tax=Pseudomaricurvus alkylphenolicus TaxID=1306991 RepID=UPI0014231C09|nr:L-histidine N(alpha)-methyltransferase [Pseudomaricurvus alkylphenolicus]NIB38632.1 L-histidine N(alpha)-methyltransferase [Pseudomaricurvus alkylphenolicus]